MQNRKVLIVDDEPMLLEIFQELMPASSQTKTAQSIDAALKALQTEAFDVVICDVSLPRGTGFKLLENCKAQAIQTPFIMVTGQITDDKIKLAQQLGAADILEKPLNFDYFETDFIKILDLGYQLRTQVQSIESELEVVPRKVS